jgi:hypothetical protein
VLGHLLQPLALLVGETLKSWLGIPNALAQTIEDVEYEGRCDGTERFDAVTASTGRFLDDCKSE